MNGIVKFGSACRIRIGVVGRAGLLGVVLLPLAACAAGGEARYGGAVQGGYNVGTPPPAAAPAVATALPGSPGRLTTERIVVNGRERSYMLYRPPGRGPHPMILMFHGGVGNGEKAAEQASFHTRPAGANYVVLYPDAIDKWNDGRSTTGTNRDDIDFVVALIDFWTRAGEADARRVYATGMSNGGMFTIRLACELSDRFAGFAPVSANLPADYASRCRPQRPVTIVFFHGTEDRFMPWDGGEVRKGRTEGAGGAVLSSPETVSRFATFDGCAPNPTISTMPDHIRDDGTRISIARFNGCRAGSTVVHVRVEGGGHAWPGTNLRVPRFVDRLAGHTSREIDASNFITDFFDRARLD